MSGCIVELSVFMNPSVLESFSRSIKFYSNFHVSG